MKIMTSLLALSFSLSALCSVSVLENFAGDFEVVSTEELENQAGCSLKDGTQVRFEISGNPRRLNIVSNGEKVFKGREAFMNTLDVTKVKIAKGLTSVTTIFDDGLMLKQETKKGLFKRSISSQLIQSTLDLEELAYSYSEKNRLKETCFFKAL